MSYAGRGYVFGWQGLNYTDAMTRMPSAPIKRSGVDAETTDDYELHIRSVGISEVVGTSILI